MDEVFPNSFRQLCWNGLHLKTPGDWQSIISGSRHILFEKDFQPVLEIRWEQSTHQPWHEQLLRISNRLTAELGKTVTAIRPPKQFTRIGRHFTFTFLSWQKDDIPNAALCLCPTCNTLVFIRFLDQSLSFLPLLAEVLETLRCHEEKSTSTEWRIQDFSLRLPPTFALDTFKMAAGLTSISFTDSSLSLKVYRLAPAGEHLHRQTLPEILSRLHDWKQQQLLCHDSENTCDCTSRLNTCQQLLFRLHRKKPFFWSRIWHLPEHNRLLAMVFESSRPIPPDQPATLCRQYEIVAK